MKEHSGQAFQRKRRRKVNRSEKLRNDGEGQREGGRWEEAKKTHRTYNRRKTKQISMTKIQGNAPKRKGPKNTVHLRKLIHSHEHQDVF